MYRVAVIGDRDSIYGYAALGLDTYPVSEHAEAVRLLKEIAENDYAVVYITESLASEVAQELEAYQERLIPAVILIPGVSGNTGMGIANVKKSVEQAVGSDIIFGGN